MVLLFCEMMTMYHELEWIIKILSMQMMRILHTASYQLSTENEDYINLIFKIKYHYVILQTYFKQIKDQHTFSNYMCALNIQAIFSTTKLCLRAHHYMSVLYEYHKKVSDKLVYIVLEYFTN